MVDREDRQDSSPTKELTQIKQESAIQAVVAAQRQLTGQSASDHVISGGTGSAPGGDQTGLEDEEDDILRRRGGVGIIAGGIADPRTLVRRPSYRKILTELGGHQNMINEDRDQEGNESGNSDDLTGSEERLGGSLEDRLGGEQSSDRQSYSSHIHPSLRVVPTGSLLGQSSLPGGGAVDHMGLHSQPQIQYSTHNSENGGGYYGNIGNNVDESTRKREIRLLKNREAARECRRKKKEYIKCLENRVAVLENQNKALIEELKNLKELYAGGKMS